MEVYSSLDGLDSNNNNFRRSRSISESSFSDSNKSESEPDFTKRKPYTYFLPINDDGLVQYKQAQSENMSSWTHVDVFNTIHAEINMDRFKWQMRHLILGMGEGNSRSLRFEDNILSNPIVTFKPSKKEEIVLVFDVRCNKYFCVFGNPYFTLINRHYDLSLLKDLQASFMKEGDVILNSPDGVMDLQPNSPVGTTNSKFQRAPDGFSPFQSVMVESSIQDFVERNYFKIKAVAELPLQPKTKTSDNFDPTLPFATISRCKRTTYSFTLDKIGYVTSYGTSQIWNQEK